MLHNGQLEQLYSQLRDQKTLDRILEQATVTDVDPKQLQGSADADQGKKTKGPGKKKATKEKQN
jgi:hypothetical protein